MTNLELFAYIIGLIVVCLLIGYLALVVLDNERRE